MKKKFFLLPMLTLVSIAVFPACHKEECKPIPYCAKVNQIVVTKFPKGGFWDPNGSNPDLFIRIFDDRTSNDGVSVVIYEHPSYKHDADPNQRHTFNIKEDVRFFRSVTYHIGLFDKDFTNDPLTDDEGIDYANFDLVDGFQFETDENGNYLNPIIISSDNTTFEINVEYLY